MHPQQQLGDDSADRRWLAERAEWLYACWRDMSNLCRAGDLPLGIPALQHRDLAALWICCLGASQTQRSTNSFWRKLPIACFSMPLKTTQSLRALRGLAAQHGAYHVVKATREVVSMCERGRMTVGMATRLTNCLRALARSPAV
jgi:hypothetical protein